MPSYFDTSVMRIDTIGEFVWVSGLHSPSDPDSTDQFAARLCFCRDLFILGSLFRSVPALTAEERNTANDFRSIPQNCTCSFSLAQSELDSSLQTD